MTTKCEVSTKQCFFVILFCFIILFSFLQRIDAIFAWESNSEQYLVDQEPMLTNSDGYYYLNIAREIQDNTYSNVYTKNAFPEHLQRSTIPPLVSVIIAYCSSVANISLNWIGIYIPVVLSLLLAIPLFLWGNYWGGRTMALSAVFMGLISPCYVYRTRLGALDTDCMNVTFALTCAYLFMRFSRDTTNKRYWFLGSGLACYISFLWWWDQSPVAVTVLSLPSLLIGLFFFYRPSRREGIVFTSCFCFIVGILLILSGWKIPFQVMTPLLNLFSYISKEEIGIFPNVGVFITEQYAPSLSRFMTEISINIPVFILSIIGLLILILKKSKEFVFLIPLLLVGLLSFYAVRFTIFLTPLLSLGLGYLCFKFYLYYDGKKTVSLILVLIMISIGWHGFQNNRIRGSHFKSQIVTGMKNLRSLTPADSVVWSWWNEGHTLVYWSDRATIVDGMFHSGRRLHYNALPMATSSYRFAANFMRFYAVRGLSGISIFNNSIDTNKIDNDQVLIDILSHGPHEAAKILADLPFNTSREQPQDWIEFFYPSFSPPLYLFLDKNLLQQAPNIFWFGRWDTETKTGGKGLPGINIDNIPFDKYGLPKAGSVEFNFESGNMKYPAMFNKIIPLQKITFSNSTKSHSIRYGSRKIYPDKTPLFESLHTFDFVLSERGEYCVNFYIPTGNGVLQDCKYANTIINKLFWQKGHEELIYFRLVSQKMPYFQIWEVNGD